MCMCVCVCEREREREIERESERESKYVCVYKFVVSVLEQMGFSHAVCICKPTKKKKEKISAHRVRSNQLGD